MEKGTRSGHPSNQNFNTTNCHWSFSNSANKYNYEPHSGRVNPNDMSGETKSKQRQARKQKGSDASHLLSFQFEQRAPVPVVTFPKTSRQRQRGSSLSQSQFLQANFKFIISPFSDKNLSGLYDPDVLIPWTEVVEVLVSNTEDIDQEQQCPICLNSPIVPKITHCGHVFCFTCILRYLDAHKEKKCPMCADKISREDVRFVRYIRTSVPIESDVINLSLLRCRKDSLSPYLPSTSTTNSTSTSSATSTSTSGKYSIDDYVPLPSAELQRDINTRDIVSDSSPESCYSRIMKASILSIEISLHIQLDALESFRCICLDVEDPTGRGDTELLPDIAEAIHLVQEDLSQLHRSSSTLNSSSTKSMHTSSGKTTSTSSGKHTGSNMQQRGTSIGTSTGVTQSNKNKNTSTQNRLSTPSVTSTPDVVGTLLVAELAANSTMMSTTSRFEVQQHTTENNPNNPNNEQMMDELAKLAIKTNKDLMIKCNDESTSNVVQSSTSKRDRSDSLSRLTPMTSTSSGDTRTSISNTSLSEKKSEYFEFYQSVDGALTFLHPLCMRMLMADQVHGTTSTSTTVSSQDINYNILQKDIFESSISSTNILSNNIDNRNNESFDSSTDGNTIVHSISKLTDTNERIGGIGFTSLAQNICGKIKEIEKLKLTTDVRQKYKFLRHLPTGCDVLFVELDMRNLVSSATLVIFEKELQIRTDKRRNIRKKQEKERRIDDDYRLAQEYAISERKQRYQDCIDRDTLIIGELLTGPLPRDTLLYTHDRSSSDLSAGGSNHGIVLNSTSSFPSLIVTEIDTPTSGAQEAAVMGPLGGTAETTSVAVATSSLVCVSSSPVTKDLGAWKTSPFSEKKQISSFIAVSDVVKGMTDTSVERGGTTSESGKKGKKKGLKGIALFANTSVRNYR